MEDFGVRSLKELNFNKVSKILFVIAEFALYITFLYIDGATSRSSVVFKYASIIVCFLYACLLSFKSKDARLTAVILAFTLLADYFLLVEGYHYALGVSLFILVQVGYRVRLHYSFAKSKKSGVQLLTVCTIGVFLVAITAVPDKIIVLVLSYFSFLLSNIVMGIKIARRTKSKKAICFYLGMILLALCDVCVGLSNLWQYVRITPGVSAIMAISSMLMWAFYLPSQVLISLSIQED